MAIVGNLLKAQITVRYFTIHGSPLLSFNRIFILYERYFWAYLDECGWRLLFSAPFNIIPASYHASNEDAQ